METISTAVDAYLSGIKGFVDAAVYQHHQATLNELCEWCGDNMDVEHVTTQLAA